MVTMTKPRIPGAGRNGVVPRPAIERLQAMIVRDEDTGCEVWSGALDKKGYARIAIGGHRSRLAHRVAYEAAHGAIPDGLTLDHTCLNKACCNPDHLEPVPSAVNNARAAAERRKRATCKHGHEFTPENTLIDKTGVRLCRECRRARQAKARIPNLEATP